MKKINRITFPMLSFVILFFSCSEKEPVRTGLENKPLPDFSLLLQDTSKHFNTANIPPSVPLVLLYFSPTCPYCKAQIEDIVDNMTSLNNIQFVFITAYPINEVQKMYSNYNLSNYKNITIAQDTGYKVAGYFGTTNVPYLAIYNSNKKLKQAFLGKIEISQIKKVISENN